MYRQDLNLEGDKVSLITTFNKHDIPREAKEERALSGKGYSKSKNLRKLGSITFIELQYFANAGDMDAAVILAQDVDQKTKTKAVRSFFKKHPEYRTSEGAV